MNWADITNNLRKSYEHFTTAIRKKYGSTNVKRGVLFTGRTLFREQNPPMMSKKRFFLTIHGHFYQPPREDPWTGRIEKQESAWPANDWNARIHEECYGPNAWSRVLNSKGQIEEIVNNYEYFSFNIGPTLMNWIRRFQPETYARIREADRKSLERLGHGNAIAQVYNHIIMPLASPRDRLVQIRWGLRDFEEHFGRKPEAMWLAETAINMDTVVDLIREGIKYVILAPSQAARVRPIVQKGNPASPWENVASHTIDTARPYRIYPKDQSGAPLCAGHLDVFFYNGSISSAVSFEHLLRSGEAFANRIEESFTPNNKPQLCSVVTDGESYGHHEPFGDMCAAYLFSRELPKRGIEVVNFGWFLEHFPPEMEAELANAHGEGSAWSCVHGVGRWYRDCGCHTGGKEGWNQKWRTPLRLALNNMKAKLDRLYERGAAQLSNFPPMEMLDDYIEVLLQEIQPEELTATARRFVEKRLKPGLSFEQEGLSLLRLLEAQKFALYSFTSCGWFFNDIEGIEPVQNLRYAHRAIELIEDSAERDEVEENFIETLKQAISNERKLNGEEVFRQFALPAMPASWRLTARALLDPQRTFDRVVSVTHELTIDARSIRYTKPYRLWQVALRDARMLQRESFYVVTLWDDFREEAMVVLPKDCKESEVVLPKKAPGSLRRVNKIFPNSTLVRIRDMFPTDLQEMADRLTHDSFEAICKEHLEYGKRHKLLFGMLEQKSVQIAKHVRISLQMSLIAEAQMILSNYENGFDSDEMEKLKQVRERIDEIGLESGGEWIKEEYGAHLAASVAAIRLDSDDQQIEKVLQLIVAAELGGVPIKRSLLERIAWRLYPEWLEAKRKKQPVSPQLYNFFGYLNFALPETV